MADVNQAAEALKNLSLGSPPALQLGSVYLVTEPNNNGPVNYKVGYSKDPTTRLRTLQTGNPRTLAVVCMIVRLK